MNFKSADGLMFITMTMIYVELGLFVVLQLEMIYMMITMIISGLAILMYYMNIQMTHLKLINGKLCLCAIIYYSQTQHNKVDLLIEEHKILMVSDRDLEHFENNKDFLNNFEKYITDNKIKFPEEITNIKEKYYYLDLRRILDQKSLDDSFQIIIEQNKKDKQKTIEFLLRDLLLSIIEPKNKEIEKDKKEEEKDENIVLQENNQEEEKKEAEEIKKNIKKFILDLKQSITFMNIIKILLMILLIIRVLEAFYISIFFFTAYMIINVVLIYLSNKYVKDLNLLKYQKPKVNLDSETINLALEQLITVYPLKNYTYIKFLKQYKPMIGFQECIIISSLPFFDDYHFAEDKIIYDGYLHSALSSNCVLEYVGDIEEEFPILYTKFSSGKVGRDEQEGLNYALIGDAKNKTYFKMMCDIRNEYATKEDTLINISASNEAWKMQAQSNKDLYDLHHKRLMNRLKETQEEKAEYDFSIPDRYYPLVYLLIISVIIAIILIIILIFKLTMSI